MKNDIPAKDFKNDTGHQSEILGAYITVGNTTVTIFNLYCPSDKDLALHTMNLPPENCLTVGDFNSHSTSWGYKESDRRGDEVEDWQIENNLLLLNDPEDPPTFFSRRWITSRKVQNQLAGSDHKPVLLAVNMNYKPSNPKTFPRWNYSKADWVKFATLSDKLCKSVKCDDSNVNRACKNFNKAILEAPNRSIPRGARRNYRPYWTEELQELEKEVTNCREQVECSPTLNNNIAHKASTARHKKAFNKAARTSWKQKTESLNLDKDGQKLLKLTKAMNDEDTKQIPIVIERGQEMVTGRRAANCFIDTYEEVSSIQVHDERKREIHKEIKEHQVQPNPPDYMNIPFNARELEDALKALKDKKSPGLDKITNEMLKHMGPKAKSKLI